MHIKNGVCVLAFSFLLLPATTLTSQAQLLWTVGLDDNGWPSLGGGGPNASFVQENGAINDLRRGAGRAGAQQRAQIDHYVADVYHTVIDRDTASYGVSPPVAGVA